MYKNRRHSTEAECRLFCCPILLSRCRFCSFLKLLSYRHTAKGALGRVWCRLRVQFRQEPIFQSLRTHILTLRALWYAPPVMGQQVCEQLPLNGCCKKHPAFEICKAVRIRRDSAGADARIGPLGNCKFVEDLRKTTRTQGSPVIQRGALGAGTYFCMPIF